jgi:hypothetical protein
MQVERLCVWVRPLSLALYVLTCIDPRVDPADFPWLRLGDAIVGRPGHAGGPRDVAYVAHLMRSKTPDGLLRSGATTALVASR